jgi:hypothetical protein
MEASSVVAGDWVMGARMDMLHSAIDSIVDSFSAIRLLYTFVLLVVACVLLSLAWATGREIVSTWGSGKIYLAEFGYFTDGVKKPEYGEQIRNESILFYRHVRGLIRSAKRSRDVFEQNLTKEDRRDQILPPELAFDKHGSLPDIDLSIQGVNVKSLLSYFLKLVSPSNPEVTATIFKTDNVRRAYVSLPEDNKSDDDTDVISSPYIIDGTDSDSDTAFRLACFLIWSQSSDRNESYHDFCDWARLLRLKSVLDAKGADAISQPATKHDIDFAVRTFERALNGNTRYPNIFSTLGGMERYIGKQTIAIGEGKTATISAVTDILRYYNVTGRAAGPTSDWKATDNPTAVDEAFFSDRFVPDCKDGKPAYPNTVRIVFEYAGANDTPVPAVMSGLLLRDESVLTYLPRGFPAREHEGIPTGAKVQAIACGNVAGEFTVAEVQSLAARNDSFMLLKVPGLLVTQGTAPFDFELEPDDIDDVILVGSMRNRASTFARPPLNTAIDNSERYISRAKMIKTMRKIRSVGELLLFDSPFSAGMIGSPILTEDGKIIGMVTGGIYVDSRLRLRLARGLLLSALKSKLAAVQVEPPKKR